MSLSLFSKYFNLKCNYDFRSPKIDLCDFCSKFDKLDNKTQEDERKFKSHSTKVREYKNTKKSFIENSDNISIEFDYNSNKVLPKLNNFERYFKRALYLYIANIDIHSRNKSFMFHWLEDEAKKGANSVATYLYYVLDQRLA